MTDLQGAIERLRSGEESVRRPEQLICQDAAEHQPQPSRGRDHEMSQDIGIDRQHAFERRAREIERCAVQVRSIDRVNQYR